MATYVISDIHGQLYRFKWLLKQVNFKFDGTDELYILGDLADWGPKPIETVQYIIELCEKYDFVHCCLGNHDKFMIDAILEGNDLRDVYYGLWGDNGGVDTYAEYLELDDAEKDKIFSFLVNRPLEFRDVAVGNYKFDMAHAAPAIAYNGMTAEQHAIWARYELNNIIPGKTSDDHIFIHGHTMTSHWIRRVDKQLNNVVIFDPYNLRFAIDCGGKGASSSSQFRLALVDLTNLRVYYSSQKSWFPIYLDDSKYTRLINSYKGASERDYWW